MAMTTDVHLRDLRYFLTVAEELHFTRAAERLYVSHHTVNSQAMAVYRKLSVTSRNVAVERARSLGLL